MSDSILYLAIVAIWAGFLVPAWVRRPSAAKSELDAEQDELDAEPDAEPAQPGQPGSSAKERPEVVFEADGWVETDIQNPEYGDNVHMHSHGAAGSRPSAEPVAKPPAPRPSQSREQMMRARRRMLTILASLVLITAAFVLAGLVQWWICVPPVVLLVLYVLLLREIAMADAELARKRAAWEARAARDVWRRSHQAWEAKAAATVPVPASASALAASQATAKVIDISSRVGDQLYDQYADAAVRAVGD